MRNNGRYSGDDQGRFGSGYSGRRYDEDEDSYRSGYRNQGRSNENRFTGWAGQRENVQFDEDYNYWRQEQMSKFDEEYATWLSERRQKFAGEFDKWRSERRKGGTQSGTEKKQ